VSASATIVRRIDWMDTDAAGIYHYSTVLRLAEAAEAALHTEHGTADRIFGAAPRVHMEFDFQKPVMFNDEVVTQITVADLGRTSITYDLRLTHDDELVATGRIVGVFIDQESMKAAPWPDAVRAAFG
jgi:YbgC/YbaW family acyl-CoA thioester hydrolase